MAVPYSEREAFGTSESLGVIGERVLCLGKAYGKITVAVCRELVDLRLCFGEDVDLGRTIYLGCDLCYLFFYGLVQLVSVIKLAG